MRQFHKRHRRQAGQGRQSAGANSSRGPSPSTDSRSLSSLRALHQLGISSPNSTSSSRSYSDQSQLTRRRVVSTPYRPSRSSTTSIASRKCLSSPSSSSPSSCVTSSPRFFTSSSSTATAASIRPRRVLGIETSCDDTAIAIVDEDKNILSNEMVTQSSLHMLHGGVVPAIAMRQHAVHINHLLANALIKAQAAYITDPSLVPQSLEFSMAQNTSTTPPLRGSDGPKHILSHTDTNIAWLEEELNGLEPYRLHRELTGKYDVTTQHKVINPALKLDIDAVSFTLGPGLSGSLGIGVDTAKAFAKHFHLPLVPVNHVIAHSTVGQLIHDYHYPYLGIVVSGGHTQIHFVENECKATILATTVDDAIGEAFDKVNRTLSVDLMDLDGIQTILHEEIEHHLKSLLIPKRNQLSSLLEKSKSNNNSLLTRAIESILKSDDLSPPSSASLPPAPEHPPNIRSLQHDLLARIQLLEDAPRVRLDPINRVRDILEPALPDSIRRTFQQLLGDSFRDEKDLLRLKPPSPPGAQIEQASTLLYELSSILSAYDLIGRELYSISPQHATSPISLADLKMLGMTKKLSAVIPSHPLLPQCYLPLPLHSCLDNSFTAMSFSGIKTRIRHIYDREIVNMSLDVDFADRIKVRLGIIDAQAGNTPGKKNPHNTHSGDHRREIEHDTTTTTTTTTNNNNDDGKNTKDGAMSIKDIESIDQSLDDSTKDPLFQSILKQNATKVQQIRSTFHRYLQTATPYLAFLHNIPPQASIINPDGLEHRQQIRDDIKATYSADDFDHDQQSLHIHQRRSQSRSPLSANSMSLASYLPRKHVEPPDEVPILFRHITNVFRLAVSAQFQSTATEHLISKLSRTLSYIQHALPKQQGIYLTNQELSMNDVPPVYSNVQQQLDAVKNHQLRAINSSLFDPKHGIIHNNRLPIVIGGGVACNRFIVENIRKAIRAPAASATAPSQVSGEFDFYTIPPSLCADNAVMIAWSGIQRFKAGQIMDLHAYEQDLNEKLEHVEKGPRSGAHLLAMMQKPVWHVGPSVHIPKPPRTAKSQKM